MAYFEDQEDEVLFGVDQEVENDSLLGDETFVSNPKPGTDPRTVTPATAEEKARARETPDDKKERLAQEAKIAAEKEKKELEDDWNDTNTDLVKDTNSFKDPKKKDSETPVLDGFEEIADGLFKVGIFTKEDDEEEEPLPTTQEEFVERFNREKEKGAEILLQDYISKYGEEYKQAFDAIYVNGVSPKEYLSKFEEIKSYKDLDLSDEDNQVRVMEADLKSQGWEDADIKSKIRKAKLNSELAEEAPMHQKALVRRETTELAKMEQKAKVTHQQKEAYQKQYSNNVHNILADKIKLKEFDGIPITKELAQKTQEFLVDNTAFTLPTGELITAFDAAILELNHPHNHAEKVKLGLILAKSFSPGKPFKLDFGSIAKTAVSKENTAIFNFNKKATSKITNQRLEEQENLLKDF